MDCNQQTMTQTMRLLAAPNSHLSPDLLRFFRPVRKEWRRFSFVRLVQDILLLSPVCF